jgi:hypothetical protein
MATEVYIRERDIQEIVSSYIYLLLTVGLLVLLSLLIHSAPALKWFVIEQALHIVPPFVAIDRLSVFERTEGSQRKLTLTSWNCFLWCLSTVLHTAALLFLFLAGFVRPLSASIRSFREEKLEYFIAVAVWMGILMLISAAQAALTFFIPSGSKFSKAQVLTWDTSSSSSKSPAAAAAASKE